MRKRVWMAVRKGIGFANTEGADLSKNTVSDIIVVDIETRGHMMKTIVNMYDEREGETGERPARRLK